MLRFLIYVAVTYAGGLLLGMPLGLALSLLLGRRLTPLSKRLNDLVPAHGAAATPDVVDAMHLRWTVRACVAIGAAVGCGVAAAAYIRYTGYSPGGLAQFVFLLCAISFWEFKILLSLPAVAAFWISLRLLGV